MNSDQHSSSGAPDSADAEPSPAGEGDSTDGSDRRSSAPLRAHRQTLSQALSAIAADPVREAIADNDQITLLGGRGRAGLILRFALPNVLPAPPGMPHWSWLVNHRAEGVIGAFCLVLAAVLVLPIPFGNMLPAFAISLIALGVLELDGLWVMIGTMTGLVSLFIVAGVVSALVGSTILLLSHAFG